MGCRESSGQQDEIGAPPAIWWGGPHLVLKARIMDLAG